MVNRQTDRQILFYNTEIIKKLLLLLPEPSHGNDGRSFVGVDALRLGGAIFQAVPRDVELFDDGVVSL